MTIIPPGPETAGPHTGPEDETPGRSGTRRSPRLTVVPPEGGPAPPSTRQQPDRTDGGTAIGADAELPPEEFDMTA